MRKFALPSAILIFVALLVLLFTALPAATAQVATPTPFPMRRACGEFGNPQTSYGFYYETDDATEDIRLSQGWQVDPIFDAQGNTIGTHRWITLNNADPCFKMSMPAEQRHLYLHAVLNIFSYEK